MLGLSKLQPLVEVGLELLFKSIHFILLLLDQFGLRGNDLLLSLLHVLFSLVGLQFLAPNLDLVCVLILFLFRQILLNLLQVQELGAELESQRQLVSKNLPVALNLSCVTFLKFGKCLGIFLLGLEEVFVPLLVEFLVLLDMCLLALLTLLRLVEDELLVPAIVVLLLELNDPVLGHLSLNILSFAFTCVSVIFEDLNEILNIVGVWLLIEGLLLIHHHIFCNLREYSKI